MSKKKQDLQTCSPAISILEADRACVCRGGGGGRRGASLCGLFGASVPSSVNGVTLLKDGSLWRVDELVPMET